MEDRPKKRPGLLSDGIYEKKKSYPCEPIELWNPENQIKSLQKDLKGVYAENAKLKAENENLKQIVENLRRENKRLRLKQTTLHRENLQLKWTEAGKGVSLYLALKKKGLSFSVLAERLGVDYHTMMHWVNGHRVWPRSMVNAACELTGLDPDGIAWGRINENR